MKRGVQLELNAPRVNWPILQSQSLECVLSDRTHPPSPSLNPSFSLSLSCCTCSPAHPLTRTPSCDTCASRDVPSPPHFHPVPLTLAHFPCTFIRRDLPSFTSSPSKSFSPTPFDPCRAGAGEWLTFPECAAVCSVCGSSDCCMQHHLKNSKCDGCSLLDSGSAIIKPFFFPAKIPPGEIQLQQRRQQGWLLDHATTAFVSCERRAHKCAITFTLVCLLHFLFSARLNACLCVAPLGLQPANSNE